MFNQYDNSVTLILQIIKLNTLSIKYSKAYRTLNVTSERESVNGAGSNRIHCRIYISFKSMLKGVTYDIYIV